MAARNLRSSPQVDEWDMVVLFVGDGSPVLTPCGLHRTKAPSDGGKRSAVAVVNGCPVDSQSRDRADKQAAGFCEAKDWGRE